MKAFNGLEIKKSVSASEPLPAGGYVAKILNAKVEEHSQVRTVQRLTVQQHMQPVTLPRTSLLQGWQTSVRYSSHTLSVLQDLHLSWLIHLAQESFQMRNLLRSSERTSISDQPESSGCSTSEDLSTSRPQHMATLEEQILTFLGRSLTRLMYLRLTYKAESSKQIYKCCIACQ